MYMCGFVDGAMDWVLIRRDYHGDAVDGTRIDFGCRYLWQVYETCIYVDSNFDTK